MRHARRVIHHSKPYLVTYGDLGAPDVFGPFAPGTEPSVDECQETNRVADDALVAEIVRLAPAAPELRAGQNHL